MARRIIKRLLARIQNEWHMCESDCIKMYIGVIEDLGCWPQRNGEELTVRHFRFWLARFMLLTSTTLAIFLGPLSVSMFWDQPVLVIIEPFAASILIFFNCVVIGSLLCKKQQFKTMVDAFNEIQDIILSYNERPQDVERKAIWFSKYTYCYYAFNCYFVSPALLVVYPAYAYVKMELMFRCWFPFEFYVTPNFEITVFLITITVAYGFVVVAFLYAFLMVLLVQAVRHLQLLNYNLKLVRSPMGGSLVVSQEHNITDVNEGSFGLEHARFLGERRMEDFNIEQRLALCVRHHQAISRYVNAIRSANDLFFIHQLNCCIFPVIMGIIVVVYTTEFHQKIIYVSALMGIAWGNEAIICWLADKVEEESELVRDAAFGCDWLRASDSFKRSLRIIMSRSNQPIVIKIAGCIRLNMQTFFEIVKLTYSYYMSLTTSLNIRPTHD